MIAPILLVAFFWCASQTVAATRAAWHVSSPLAFVGHRNLLPHQHSYDNDGTDFSTCLLSIRGGADAEKKTTKKKKKKKKRSQPKQDVVATSAATAETKKTKKKSKKVVAEPVATVAAAAEEESAPKEAKKKKKTKLSKAAKAHMSQDLKSTSPNYRIQRELKEFLRDPPEGLTVQVGKNLRVWIVTVEGPGIYKGETFRLRIAFPPQYPVVPPSVYFLQPHLPV